MTSHNSVKFRTWFALRCGRYVKGKSSKQYEHLLGTIVEKVKRELPVFGVIELPVLASAKHKKY